MKPTYKNPKITPFRVDKHKNLQVRTKSGNIYGINKEGRFYGHREDLNGLHTLDPRIEGLKVKFAAGVPAEDLHALVPKNQASPTTREKGNILRHILMKGDVPKKDYRLFVVFDAPGKRYLHYTSPLVEIKRTD